LPQSAWGAGPGPERYINLNALKALDETLTAAFTHIIDLRDSGINKGAPLYLHTYDHATPRNAPAGFGFGPWLQPVLKAAGIAENDWVPLATYLIDHVADNIIGFAKLAANVFVVDTRGTLTPAALDTTGVSNHWENEIHPTPSGYSRLAAIWESKLAQPPLNLT
jgi:hypothetical protein